MNDIRRHVCAGVRSGSRRRAHGVMALATRLGIALVAISMLALVTTGVAQAATFANERELRDSTSAGVRSTFVVDPGAGQWLSRAQLLAEAEFYRQRGFDRDFLTWAPESSIAPDTQTRWSRCGMGISGVNCPDGSPLDYNEVREVVTGGNLTVLGYDKGAFISLVCGNHTPTGAQVTPPTISGVKYEDVDGDGSRNAGEPGLRNWTIKLRFGGQDGPVDDDRHGGPILVHPVGRAVPATLRRHLLGRGDPTGRLGPERCTWADPGQPG